MFDATALALLRSASILFCIKLFLSFLVFLVSLWERPTILFLVFLYISYKREELELYCRWYNYQPLQEEKKVCLSL